MTWIAGNHYRVVGPDREVCLFNKMPIRQDDPSYVTEIQYPVENYSLTRKCEVRMITEPRVDDRAEQPSVGIRTPVTMPELPTIIPQLHSEVYGWLKQQGIPPSGAPFIRYHVINMPGKLDIELGVPVATPVSGKGRVSGGTLPAGRYASLTYIGPYEGDGLMKANGALLDWMKQQGLAQDRFDDPSGDGFVARYETYITDPGNEPDPSKWQTEVAIRLADH